MKEAEKNVKIHIIGAGISGLIAAQNLETLGFAPTILEASNHIGGRVRTDIVEGYQLDQGFQVLLEAYPMAKKYLNYEALQLQPLRPGALIYQGDKKETAFGDPLRDAKFLLPTLLSSVGTLKDKMIVYQLSRQLKNKSLESIFMEKEVTTLEYLKNERFSDQIINLFFRPFFSGIFLEPDLSTSSRMFEYVYKLFGEGNAMIPKGGIGAIADQLKDNLKQTKIELNTPVTQVSNRLIVLDNGESLETDFTIVATDPSLVLSNYSSSLEWKACDNLYFTVQSRTISSPIIGLNGNSNSLINNIFYPTSVATDTKGKEELISVTVVRRHNLSGDELIREVKKELDHSFGISKANFLKHYSIQRALPKLQDLQYQRDESESLLTEHIAIAGDQQLNGSLNAAMISGENAATIAHRALADSLLTFG